MIFFTFPDDAVPGRGQDGDGGGAAAGRPRQSQVDLRGERVIVATIGILRSLKEDRMGMGLRLILQPTCQKVGREPDLHLAARFSP